MGEGVLGDRGRRNEARKLARSGLDWLTEGLDTRDLKEVKVLLDDLAA
jgi:hypothetical protein